MLLFPLDFYLNVSCSYILENLNTISGSVFSPCMLELESYFHPIPEEVSFHVRCTIRPLLIERLFPVHRPRIENVTASKNIITAIAHGLHILQMKAL